MRSIVIRFFFAPWCAACHRMSDPGGSLDQLRAYIAKKVPEDQAIVEPVNVDVLPDPLKPLDSEERMKIGTLPTTHILLADGLDRELVQVMTGYQTFQKLKEAYEKVLADPKR